MMKSYGMAALDTTYGVHRDQQDTPIARLSSDARSLQQYDARDTAVA